MRRHIGRVSRSRLSPSSRKEAFGSIQKLMEFYGSSWKLIELSGNFQNLPYRAQTKTGFPTPTPQPFHWLPHPSVGVSPIFYIKGVLSASRPQSISFPPSLFPPAYLLSHPLSSIQRQVQVIDHHFDLSLIHTRLAHNRDYY